MKERAYKSALLYTTNATRMAFTGLAATFALQVWLIAQAWVVLSGFTNLIWLSVLILLVLLSNIATGFVFVEMLKDSDQYRPRFARAGWLHVLLNAGVCASMLIQMLVEANLNLMPAILESALWLKLTISLTPLLLASHAGTYVLIHTRPNQPYYTYKYGYPARVKRSKRKG
ncbi:MULTISPECIES: hypothetical protein [Pseudomonas]|uniref:hypothetical protein n=1 Tax=Pseudomonas TaxID=286 RepID=UPI000F026826|nr:MULTISPECIES: hypothetical protein [Pseudomonas]MBD8681724.1 hypothetical protein [Pseudomonas sp. CFBP 13719]